MAKTRLVVTNPATAEEGSDGGQIFKKVVVDLVHGVPMVEARSVFEFGGLGF